MSFQLTKKSFQFNELLLFLRIRDQFVNPSVERLRCNERMGFSWLPAGQSLGTLEQVIDERVICDLHLDTFDRFDTLQPIDKFFYAYGL